MATTKQVENMLILLEKYHPADFFKRVNETQVGIGAVLRLLSDAKGTVTAGNISEFLNISTARVAVLTKKMVDKGLITKESGATDARVTIVKLTEFGKETFGEMKTEMFQQLGDVIDKVGEERLMEFIIISKEIRDAVKEPNFDF